MVVIIWSLFVVCCALFLVLVVWGPCLVCVVVCCLRCVFIVVARCLWVVVCRVLRNVCCLLFVVR